MKIKKKKDSRECSCNHPSRSHINIWSNHDGETKLVYCMRCGRRCFQKGFTIHFDNIEINIGFVIVIVLCFFSGCMRQPVQPPIVRTTAAAVVSTCTFTTDKDNNVLLGPGCTSADIFVNAGASDFRLATNSPAIGRALCLPEVQTDIVGNPRPTPGRPPGMGCDIGAYQYVTPKPPTGLTIKGVTK